MSVADPAVYTSQGSWATFVPGPTVNVVVMIPTPVVTTSSGSGVHPAVVSAHVDIPKPSISLSPAKVAATVSIPKPTVTTPSGGSDVTPFVVGTDWPSDTPKFKGPRTSLLPGGALTVVTLSAFNALVAAGTPGTLSAANPGGDPGTVLRGYQVSCGATWPTFKAGLAYVDCEFILTTDNSGGWFVPLQATTAQPTTYFEYCRIRGGSANTYTWGSSIGWHDYVAEHCETLGGVDNFSSGYNVLAANTHHAACYGQKRPICPDPTWAGGATLPDRWSHADSVEVVGGDNHVFVGMEFDSENLAGGTVPTGATGDPYLLAKLTDMMILCNYSANPTTHVYVDSCKFSTWVNVNSKSNMGANTGISGHINDCIWVYPDYADPHYNGYSGVEINFGTNNYGDLTTSGNQRWNSQTSAWVSARESGTK